MVSPVFKAGFGASHIEAVAQNGNSAAFFSPGAFAGAPAGLANTVDSLDYVSRRRATSWETTSIIPPADLMPFVNGHDISVTLAADLAMGDFGPNVEHGALRSTEAGFLLHETTLPDITSNWELAYEAIKTIANKQLVLTYDGASADFCHLFFRPVAEKGEELLLSAKNATEQAYELDRGCGGEPAGLRLVALDDKGKLFSPGCATEVGVFVYNSAGNASKFGAVSTDGQEVFFTTCVRNFAGDYQVFARLAGAHTLEVSKPLTEVCGESEIPCKKALERPSANFAGASEDGTKVFFTTKAKLTATDKDLGEDLYMAEIGCTTGEEECEVSSRRVIRLVQVSQTASSGEAGVQGVVRIAPDGSHAYFVASGDLLSQGARETLEAEGRAIPSSKADNLYVYDVASGSLAFVGDLCSKYLLSGEVEDIHCLSTGKEAVDTTLWLRASGGEVQTADTSGDFLVFASYAQLTSDDTDTAKDIYRYDAKTDKLTRISAGEAGYGSNGNSDGFNASILQGHEGGSVQFQHELDSRTASDDGSRIVFTTAERLSPSATNKVSPTSTLSDAYEWHEGPGRDEGTVSLVSGGSAETPVEDVVISAEGGDVFFVTTEGLVPEDVDGEADVYDARVGGGFPPPTAPQEPCSSDACQGPLSVPAPLVIAGSESQAAGENFPPPKRSKTKHKKKLRHHKARKRRAKRSARRARGSAAVSTAQRRAS